MIARPESLPHRPVTAIADPLSDVFRTVRFTRAIYYTVDAAGPWPPVRVPDGRAVAPAFGSGTRTVLSYHVIAEGDCWTGLEGGPDGDPTAAPVPLARGDVVLYPRGDPYFLASGPVAGDGVPDAAGLCQLLAGVASGEIPPIVSMSAGRPARFRVVCGFLGSDAPPFNPLLDTLPRMVVVRQPTPRLARLVELALAEVDGAGAASVRERLSESLFLETIRTHLEQAAPAWLGAARDPVVGRALALIHAAPTEPWTAAGLAREAGASRSTFVDRFTRLVGRPPIDYLAAIRMRLAADRLVRPDATVAEAADAAGYASEAAFSRAFKKATGVTPGAWRDAQQARGRGG